MTTLKTILGITLLGVMCFSAVPPPDLERAMRKYWNASTEREKDKAVKDIEELNPSFDEVFVLLRKGKPYKKAPTGFVKVDQQHPRLPPKGLVIVPENYSPDKKYPVRVHLHGLVSNSNPDFLYEYTVDTLNREILKAETIFVFPTSWYRAPWWDSVQVDNLNRMLRWVKENYNIDENRVRLTGVSDGATGAYYFSNGDQTPWANVAPYIGSLRASVSLGDRPVFLNNFSNTPLFVVNTGRDHIFKKELELPYHARLKQVNANATVFVVDSSGHSMRWLPILSDSIERFAKTHVRDPYPVELVWQTENETRFNRFRYALIEKIGETASKGKIENATLPGQSAKIVSGILRVQRQGNRLDVQTQNVRQYKLLLSPDVIDFSKPVTVYTNGVKSYEGKVVAEVSTLLKWNRIDNDRAMLFGAELTVVVE